jgi:hypothetical protein
MVQSVSPNRAHPHKDHWVRIYAWMLFVNAVLIAIFYILSTSFQP